MHYFVTYFDHTLTGNYWTLLNHWLKAMHQAGIQAEQISVITDARTMETRAFGPIQAVVVRPAPFAAYVRTNNHFDYKSALICAALPMLPPDAVVMDCDAIVKRDPTMTFEAYSGQAFAMPPDSGNRTIPWGGKLARRIPEHSSSVMLFGDADPGVRGALVDNYLSAWNWLRDNDDARGIIDDIREQRAWSLVHFWTDAPLLIPELNWSPYHWPANPDAFIVHHHGQKKFADLR